MLGYGVDFFRKGWTDAKDSHRARHDLSVSCIMNEVGVDSEAQVLDLFLDLEHFLLLVDP